MDSNIRYQILSTEEVPITELEEEAAAAASMAANVAATTASVSYLPTDENSEPILQSPPPPTSPPDYDEPPKGAYLPPDYCVATDLPTYDEVQRLKMEEETRRETCLTDPEGLHHEDSLLGTDFVFFCSFFVAFLFNWIGFLLLMCFCQTIAGRYGALAGFGLSLAKWTLIVKHSTDLISADNSWLWWLILAFGVFICVRAVLQYIHVKREWHVLSHAAQERLVYFY